METASAGQSADSGPDAVGLFIRRLALFLAIVAACLLACYLLLLSFIRLEIGLGELSRLPVIEHWYTEHAASDEEFVVVLGDSLGRTAFNARHYNQTSGEPGRAWNLASSARTYPEMLLDIGRPALQDAQLILFISPVTSFSPSKLGLNPRKANVYGLLGLPDRLDDNIAAYGSRLDPAAFELLAQPRWQQVLAARWRLPEFAKDSLQMSVGSQRERHRYLLTDYNRDLQYPDFGDSLGRQAQDRAVARRVELLRDPAYCGLDDPACQQALADVVRGLEEHSAGLLVVMYPQQQQYRDWLAGEYPHYNRAWLQELLGPETEILDLTDYEAEALFRDDLHISDAASRGLTDRIMLHLQQTAGALD